MKKPVLLLLLLMTVSLFAADKYEATWESINSRPTPSWFQDAKFGIFIHWGLYAVPAWGPVGKYSEWYWHQITNKSYGGATWEYHLQNWGKDFKYEYFAPMFKAELYDPDHWADIFKRSGAKYVVPTSKHHEGYCMWPSEEANKTWGRPWNSMDIGPKRDLLGELMEAGRKVGLKMGFYYSLYEWYNPLWLEDRDRYVTEHMHPQFKDVVSRYAPAIIFADGEWDMPAEKWRSTELLAWLFNESPCKDEVVINDRWGKGCRHKNGGYYTTEYTAGMDLGDHPWEESRGMGYSYGYNRAETIDDYKSGRELILVLIDMVSRGGNLLLDIGPDADGRIPTIMEERLLEIGNWLAINGEAIYGTRPWKRTRQWSEGEIPKVEYGKEYMVKYDVMDAVKPPSEGKASVEAFFTSKGDDLYAIFPRWPEDGQLTINAVQVSPKTKATLLGLDEELEYNVNRNSVSIDLPKLTNTSRLDHTAYVVKLTNVE